MVHWAWARFLKVGKDRFIFYFAEPEPDTERDFQIVKVNMGTVWHLHEYILQMVHQLFGPMSDSLLMPLGSMILSD